ncbi:hypothetical protein N7537_002827 [Penicillium hordei]|uniref:Uncharacterized protein n=1 Tax=Penicillium hordei TaxID=40994 RepID=A0AAD6H825_9EURO|nr:uncharacterized protein N7537_002827 [Penicillium hordei]KAJ5617713.1 hypothetical protein N7537_002827 [Penicillium hordei]
MTSKNDKQNFSLIARPTRYTTRTKTMQILFYKLNSWGKVAIMKTDWTTPEVAAVEFGDHEAKKAVRSYLARFEYLDPYREVDEFDAEVDGPVTLRVLQHPFGVNVTGRYDTKTQAIMNEKRCGFPDNNGIVNFVLPCSSRPKPVIS